MTWAPHTVGHSSILESMSERPKFHGRHTTGLRARVFVEVTWAFAVDLHKWRTALIRVRKNSGMDGSEKEIVCQIDVLTERLAALQLKDQVDDLAKAMSIFKIISDGTR